MIVIYNNNPRLSAHRPQPSVMTLPLRRRRRLLLPGGASLDKRENFSVRFRSQGPHSTLFLFANFLARGVVIDDAWAEDEHEPAGLTERRAGIGERRQ